MQSAHRHAQQPTLTIGSMSNGKARVGGETILALRHGLILWGDPQGFLWLYATLD